MINYKTILLCGLLALVTKPGLAAECHGVALPDSVNVGGSELMLNGMGVRKATMLKVKVYVAGLYLTSRTNDGAAIIANDQPRHLVLSFLRDVDLEDIQKAWKEGFENNAGSQMGALQDHIGQLQNAMVDFKTGQTLTFSYAPGAGVNVIVNGESKAMIEGADFAAALISIWLGPEPPNSDLKEGLLGAAGCE